MIDLARLFSSEGFMPHGMCYLWRPDILALHVGADSLIVLAYSTIPVTLVYFVRKRPELRFTWIFLCFAIFIVACGASHAMEIVTIWVPLYWLSGGVKIVTALASVATAILLVKLVPAALRFPTPSALLAANANLAREILERKYAEQRVLEINASLEGRVKEREIMLQEIHHRVKNNLQVISSLINMQARDVKDGPIRSALRECQARIQTIALIHETLYQSKDYARVPFSEYVETLATNIFQVGGVSPSTITLSLAIEPLSLAVDKAIPCGLLLNELITNALKHAFPDARRGTVRVGLRKAGEREVILAVGDDGIGLSGDFDQAQSNSLGAHLVMTLVEQLDGRLEITRSGGTTFSVTFPVEAQSQLPMSQQVPGHDAAG